MVKNRSKSKLRIKNGLKSVPRQVTRTALAINTKTRNIVPKFTQSSAGTVLSHREILIESASVSPTFTIDQTIAVQPAISTYSHGSPLGTWLPKVAAEYDNYSFESLRVHFITSASSLQKGTICMAYDPNPESTAPATFSDLRNMAHAVTGPCRENLTLDLTKAVKDRKLLTRTRAVTAYPLYDAGRIFLGSNLGDSVPVGYYEVEYKIRLMNPQTSPSTEVVTSTVCPAAVVFTDDGATSSGALYFGTSNGSRNATALTNYLMRMQAPQGDTNLITFNNPSSVYPSAGSATIGGVTYSWAGTSQGLATFRFTYPGRYRCLAVLNGDFQDYATFGATIAKWVSPSLAQATDRTVTFGGNLVSIPVLPGSSRGLSNPTVPGDDLALSVDQTFVVTSSLDEYAFVVGVRNIASISENGTGSYYSGPNAAAGFGASFIKLEYLGPVPTL